MLDLTKEAFDQIAIPIDCGVEAAPTGGCGSAWNDRLCPGSGDGVHGVHGALTVIAFVGQHMASLQSIEQTLDLGNVVTFAAG